MALRVGIRQLREEVSAWIKRAAQGEVIEVTDRGKAVARIVPAHASVLDQMIAEGRATAARGDLLETMRELGLPAPHAGGMTLSQALAELRSDER